MKATRIMFGVCLIVSILLLVAGFFTPPMGVIDGSVLSAVGELFAFAALFMLPSIIHGRSVELTHGNTTLSIEDKDEDNK